MSVRVMTVVEMGLPSWMTSYAQHIFGIPTHMPLRQRLVLTQTALELPEGFVVLEIGSYLGASTAFLAAAALQKAGTVHAVDTWMNNAMGAEGEWDTWIQFQANVAPFKDVIVTHRGRSADVHAREGDIPCDMLFIDGDHSYEGVLTDLRTWLPSLRPGGVLAMDDFNQTTVQQAFNEIVGTQYVEAPKMLDLLMVCRPQLASATAKNA